MKFCSQEAVLDDMLLKAKESGYNVLVGIDDISRTDETVKFLSIVGKHFIECNTNLYFLCTGLYENMRAFSEEPSLTFFMRGDTVELP